MKICSKCSEDDQSKFYACSSKCKECIKAQVHAHRILNLEKIQEYDRNRPNKADRNEFNKAAAKTEHGKLIKRKTTRNYDSKNPEKRKAVQTVNNAIRDGRLLRESCSKCGNEKAEAHHEDYLKPLEVIFYCDYHHKQRHKEIRAEERKTK